MISPDEQNNDRKVSDCVSLTRIIFVLPMPLKQCISLKWPLNNLNHLSHSYLLNYWSFPFFVNGDRHIFPHKNGRGLKDLNYCCNRFSNFKVFYITIKMDISLIYKSKDKVSELIISLEFSSYRNFFSLRAKFALERNG